MSELEGLPLSPGVTSRVIKQVNGLDIHVLEACADQARDLPKKERPLLLLLHGFPELAYSYRKIIGPLSLLGSGYHVVAPDQRGYGRTSGWNIEDIESFRMLNLVTDIVALVIALGYRKVECIVGHDSGSAVAAYCALIRPDMFMSVVMMSAPFSGPPSFSQSITSSAKVLAVQLLTLDPPRKHYIQYYSPPSYEADKNMREAPQGLLAFMRAYYHMKSADWPFNDPHPLSSWSAQELAKMPEYYIMDATKGMAETVAPCLPPHEPSWLTNDELCIYVKEFNRTTFQGGLHWYQYHTTSQPELSVFAGKSIQVPALFISGRKDWGMYQSPGSLQHMVDVVCEEMRPGSEGVKVVDNAGHWVQQEQPEEVVRIISEFLDDKR
ncbi:putative hydrolase or acyltransferase of alpha/beta superfamily [Hysterangium stoloniferum]|nr:putative hydrolase or acyltransferase of alpha/beta superfamily [Hysterangium stoloniferum]